MKYKGPTCYGSKVIIKVKVFFHRHTDKQTGQKLYAPGIRDSAYRVANIVVLNMVMYFEQMGNK